MGNTIPFKTGTIQIDQKIGDGGFSQVYLGHYQTDVSRKVAVKIMGYGDDTSLKRIKNEISLHQQLSRCPNIVKYFDHLVLQQQHQIPLVMEFCPRTFVSMLEDTYPNQLPFETIKNLMLNITEALEYIHSINFCHRDIKIENVLLTSGTPNTFKLADFGSAIPSNTFIERRKGDAGIIEEDIEKYTTPDYRSPEMVKLYECLPIGDKADIWALGCLLYKAIFFVTPFDGSPMKIMRGTYTFPTDIDEQLKLWLSLLLQVNQEDRCSAEYLVQLIKGNDKYFKLHELAPPHQKYLDQKFNNTPLPKSDTIKQQQHTQSSFLQQKQKSQEEANQSIKHIDLLNIQTTKKSSPPQQNTSLLSFDQHTEPKHQKKVILDIYSLYDKQEEQNKQKLQQNVQDFTTSTTKQTKPDYNALYQQINQPKIQQFATQQQFLFQTSSFKPQNPQFYSPRQQSTQQSYSRVSPHSTTIYQNPKSYSPSLDSKKKQSEYLPQTRQTNDDIFSSLNVTPSKKHSKSSSSGSLFDFGTNEF